MECETVAKQPADHGGNGEPDTVKAVLAAPVRFALAIAAMVDPFVEEVAKHEAEEGTADAGKAHGGGVDVVHEVRRGVEDWINCCGYADGPREVDHGGKADEEDRRSEHELDELFG